MGDMLKKGERSGILFLLLLVVSVFCLGYCKQTAEMGIMATFALMLLCLIQLDNILEVTGLGIKIKLKKTLKEVAAKKEDLEQLSESMIILTLYSLIPNRLTGSSGMNDTKNTMKAPERHQRKAELKSLAGKFKILSEKEIEKAFSEFSGYYSKQHILRILEKVSDEEIQNRLRELGEKALRGEGKDSSYEDVKTAVSTLKKEEIEGLDALLIDYKHYLEKDELRRPKEWSDRV
jgi:hypothetical protein